MGGGGCAGGGVKKFAKNEKVSVTNQSVETELERLKQVEQKVRENYLPAKSP